MTPDDEARFITLWQQGLSHDAMAQQLGCPVGTIKSRAHTLQKQGKLQPRQRGGTAPQRTASAPQKQAPVQRPAQTFDTGAVSSVDTDAVQAFDTGAVQRLDRLEGEVQGLMQIVRSLVERLDAPAVQTPVQMTTLPPLPKGKAVRWNIWIHEAVREEITAQAQARDMAASQLVQEILWRYLRGGEP
jgi:transposase